MIPGHIACPCTHAIDLLSKHRNSMYYPQVSVAVPASSSFGCVESRESCGCVLGPAGYAERVDLNHFKPTLLGIALLDGYDRMVRCALGSISYGTRG